MATALVFFQALYFNYIMNHYKVYERSSYLPAFSYILISSLFLEFMLLTPALIANTFLLMALSRVFGFYKKESALSLIFDASMYTSIASLFFFPYAVFFIFIIASIVVLRPFSLREFLIAIVGVVLPYYFLGVYFFWIHQLPEFLHTLIISELRFSADVLAKNIRVIVEGVSVLFIFIWTVLYVQANLFRMVVQVRNYLVVILLFFIAGLLSLPIQFSGELYHFAWLAVPGGTALAFFFAEYKRPLISEIFHLFLILSIFFFQYFYLFS